MQDLEKIVAFLNELIEKQPDIISLFHAGVSATEEAKAMTSTVCRVSPDDSEWVTGTGVISAIGRIIGADEGIEIRSVWDGEGVDWHLARFVVGPSENNALTQKNAPVFIPKNITITLDGDQYCVLLGSDMMVGVVGFGGPIQEAIDAFCEAWGDADMFEQKRAIDSLNP